LQNGHSVVTTVRSQDKANQIKDAHPKLPSSQLEFAIVEDIAQEGAFDKAVVSDPPFEAVIHTASPFHFNTNDPQKDLLDPAIIGTTGILKSIKKNAPTVKRVVVTSSFASIINPGKGSWPEHTYSEADWNPVTHEEALKNPQSGYRASKTFAEKAAWDFVEKEKPNFALTTLCPPLVLGPIVHYLNSLDRLNTSNTRLRDAIAGKYRDAYPPGGPYIWVDVRDLALLHVKAISAKIGNERYFVTAGHFSGKGLVDIIRKDFPEYKDQLTREGTEDSAYPKEGVYKVNNKKASELLGKQWISLEKSVVDTVKSLKAVGA
jgi:nucleoside-diphosphate-sugar epimerase